MSRSLNATVPLDVGPATDRLAAAEARRRARSNVAPIGLPTCDIYCLLEARANSQKSPVLIGFPATVVFGP